MKPISPEKIAGFLSGLRKDDIPIERMTDADQAVRKAAVEIPAEVSERLGSADTLSDADRETIIDIA